MTLQELANVVNELVQLGHGALPVMVRGEKEDSSPLQMIMKDGDFFLQDFKNCELDSCFYTVEKPDGFKVDRYISLSFIYEQ
jgi:hypothetical protein